MSEFIPRKEHEEFAKRMEDEHHRQNARIKSLEETVREISELTTSVKEMAVSMKSMLQEQKDQGERLGKLESRDGEKWRKFVGDVLKTIVGALIGYILAQIGLV